MQNELGLLACELSTPPLYTGPVKETKKERTWTATKVQNLYRHKGGGYYGRFKISGKQKWVTLDTQVFTTAKLRLADEAKKIAELRASGADADGMSLKFAKLIETYLTRVEADASISLRTKQGKREGIKRVTKSWPEFASLKPSQLKPATVADWSNRLRTESTFSRPGAKTVHRGFSADAVNKAVDTVIHLLDIAVEKGAILRNPLKSLPPGIRIKHEVRSKKPELPPTHLMRKLLDELEAPPELPEGLPPHLANLLSSDRQHIGEFARFLAYSGARLSEAGAMTWEHVKGRTLIIPGTKTNTSRDREIPQIRAMSELMKRIRQNRAKNRQPCEGPIFRVKECQKSIDRACETLGIKRITHHDFRHYFATVCIESGVDIPTVSKWLGHADGGALAMRTYGHLRQEHSIAQAKKVSF